MVYIDETDAELESVDLSKGYLVDAAWIDHPEVPEQGHFEYDVLPGGGRLQHYIVDVPYRPAYREVTVQRYILYTQEELDAMNPGGVSDARVDELEAKVQEHEEALASLIGGVQDA